MKRLLISTLLAGAAFATQSASAAVLLDANNVVHNKVKAFSDLDHPDVAVDVFGKTTAEDELVKFTGNTTIHVTAGAGYALINDITGANNFNSVTIALDSYLYGFKAIEFGISFENDDISNKAPGYMTVTANFLVGASETFDFSTNSFLEFTTPNDRSFVLTAGLNQTLKSITLSSGVDRFSKLKQTDIELAPALPPPAVPEPATWAMMLTGFGAVGYAMRRRKIVVSFA